MPTSIESIAKDALFIRFPVTDGDKSRRPDNMKPPPLSAREVNWHRKMTMDEKYTCRWRNLIGQGIAKLLDKPDKEKHCLQSFPEGYWMFDHNKGPISNIRHDLYLYGSQTVLRFRSPAEFIPHGFWLLTDPTLNTVNCGCKYCGGSGKKSQTEISEALGLPTNRGPTAIKKGGSSRIRTGAHRVPKVHKPMKSRGIDPLPADTPWVPLALREGRTVDPAWRISSLNLKLATSVTRISDLRSDRRFRIGELVWCKWEQDSHVSVGEGVDRPQPFWPAIVLEYSLESVVDHRSPSCSSFSVTHKRLYSLLRLGSSSEEPRTQFECTVDEAFVLPWQAHQIGLSSWPSMDAQSDALTYSFTLALRTAQKLVEFWAVCNRLPIRVPSSSLSRDHPKTEIFPPRRLDCITESTLSTSALSIPYPDDSPPQPSPTRLKPLSPRKRSTTDDTSVERLSMSTSAGNLSLLEPPPQHVQFPRQPRGPTVIESQYEGLWYGAERIWLGDVVRLCPEREAFTPSLRLSHMKRGNASWRQAITPSPGAVMRGVLMRVDRIFAHVRDTDAKECMVTGPLYEIAPKEWTAKLPRTTPSAHPSEPASHSEPMYYPWDMPESPPPKLSHENGTHPSHVTYPLPPAPSEYALRPLLPPESEITFPVSFIAGRYYPDILEWPLSAPILPQVPQDIPSLSLAAAAETREVSLLSLCGLAPGRFNHAVCVDIRLASRTRMLEEAARLGGSQSQKLGTMDLDGE